MASNRPNASGGAPPGTLGLQLAEAKDLLAAVQDTVAGQQATAAITKQVACPDCGRAHRHKDTRVTIVVRSLFGTLRFADPRWWPEHAKEDLASQ